MDNQKYLELAGQLANKIDSRMTWQNPRVGAVIVKNDKIISTGVHKIFGEKHAEIDALDNLQNKDDLKGATLYVTLEPCAHRGKVGSCAKEIINWQLAEVVVGSLDPNPLVRGKGIKILKSSGIKTTVVNVSWNNFLNPKFNFYFEHKQPYITLKMAQSLDGKVNNAQDTNYKITNILADVDVHKLRSENSAILIGSDTALIDDPNLTVRYSQSINNRQPLRVILDRRGRLINSHFAMDENTLIYTSNLSLDSHNNYRYIPNGDMKNILDDLYSRKIQSILVEGGPKIINSFIRQGLWNKLFVYQNNEILGQYGTTAFYSRHKLGKLISVNEVGNTTKMEFEN